MNPEITAANAFTNTRLVLVLLLTALLVALGIVLANGVHKRIYAYAPNNFLQENEVLSAEVSKLIASDLRYLGMENVLSVAFITTDTTESMTYAYMRIVKLDGTETGSEVSFKNQRRVRVMELTPSAWVVKRDPINENKWIVLTDQEEFKTDPRLYFAKDRFASVYRWLEKQVIEPSEVQSRWAEEKSKLLQDQKPST
jgi:cell division protein FtsL